MAVLLLACSLVFGEAPIAPVADAPQKVPEADDYPIPLHNPDLDCQWFRFDGAWCAIKCTDFWCASRCRSYLQLGTNSGGMGFQWELKNNVSMTAVLEASPHGIGLPVTLDWYPMAGVHLDLGFDLLQWRIVTALMLGL